MAKINAILVAVDGSANSDRAVAHALAMIAAGMGAELHLLNVQPSFGGAISSFVGREQLDTYRREEGEKALASALALAAKAGVTPTVHIGVGRHGQVVQEFVAKCGADQVVLGTRGHTGLAGVLLGSVAQDVIAHVEVPVTLVK